jgi:hypothetical protein
MRSVLVVLGLLVPAIACGGSAARSGPVILGMHNSAGDGAPGDADDGLQAGALDPGRDYAMERESFERLARSGRADPGEIRQALGVAPDSRFSYETLAGDTMVGAEYRLKGPRPDAPFFEAYAQEHEADSYYVYYERGWFKTRAVDCGFQRTGMYGGQFADG